MLTVMNVMTLLQVNTEELEPKCLRWVQYTSSELKVTRLDPAFGYKYTHDESNIIFYEFHIDYC